MRVVVVLIPMLVTLAGCVTPPVQPKTLPEVTCEDYDRLWDATVQAVETHFDLFVQRKDQGYIVSSYKRSHAAPGGLQADAQTGYDRTEEFMHVVRRRLSARVYQRRKGLYTVRLEVMRERQGFVPARPDFSGGSDLYDHRATALDDAVDQGETVTWQPLGRDKFLEQKLLARIAAAVGTSHSTK